MGAPVVSQALETLTATIENGGSLSGAVDLGGRIRSGTAGTPVNQTAARTFTLIVQP
jgi:hypothetical protein